MKKLVLFLMVAMLATTANAQNLLTNGSFETDTVADGSTLLAAPTDWVGWLGTWGVFNPTGDGTGDFDSAVPDGDNVLMCGDQSDNSWSDVWQETVLFDGGVQVGQIIDFSVMHAAISSGKGIPFVELRFYWALEGSPYASPGGNGNVMVSLDRANNDRDWREFNWQYEVTAEDAAGGFDGITVGVLGWAGGSGSPSSKNNPVFFDDAVLTVFTPDPNAQPQASYPRPADEEEAVALDTLLQWKPAVSPLYGLATEHQVYFGTDETAVADATTPDATVPEDGDSFSDATSLITNPSFESDVLSEDARLGSEPDSWDTWVVGVRYVWNPPGDGTSDFDSAVPDGDNVVELGDGLTFSEAYQYIPVAGGLQAGQVYTVSVKHAGLASDLNTTWITLRMHASLTSDPNDLWGPHGGGFDGERAVSDRDWREYSVDLDVDALGVAGYDGFTFGMTAWENYDPSYYDDVRLSVYDAANDPTYDPTLLNETEYFWRIDEVYDNAGELVIAGGGVWSFWTPRCGQTGQYYDLGDLNEDCYTNINDLALLALDFLTCRDPANVECDLWSGP